MKVRGALQLERNLNDDYVKFVRFAQIKVEETRVGIVGLITNNAYLENLTFPGMRSNLDTSFNSIRVINLHGSVKTGGLTPQGRKDENVFDIQQGVAISLLSKLPHKTSNVRTYCDLWGLRADKEQMLSKRPELLLYQILSPEPDTYLFVPDSSNEVSEYRTWKALDEIFVTYGTGVMTNRNGLTIGLTEQELVKSIKFFIDQTIEEKTVSETLGVKSNALWNLRTAREQLRTLDHSKFFRPIDFRPFDTQVIFYHPMAVDNMRRNVMETILRHENQALVVSRQQFKQGFQHVLVTKRIFDECFLSAASREKASGFPMLGGTTLVNGLPLQGQDANIKSSFLACTNQPGDKSAAKLKFNYIYAVLHSGFYRNRYAEHLKRGYPRVPEPSNVTLIDLLAALGGKLVALHLAEFALKDEASIPADWPRYPRPARFTNPDHTVMAKFPTADKAWKDGRVAINASSGFEGVPEEVWKFHIGGYQVCHKWLKDRKGRSLSDEDILHYCKIVTALNETIRLMRQIDEVINQHGGWPGAFATAEPPQPPTHLENKLPFV